MPGVDQKLRLARREDTAELVQLHGEAWRYAYRGVIPALVLERMIARRGANWWARAGGGDTLIKEFDGRIAGYASYGGARSARFDRCGEIYELYLRPEFHGAGFGRMLFDAARLAASERRTDGVIVWALSENELACRFYRAVGGRERARGRETIDGARLDAIAFHWPSPPLPRGAMR